MIGKLTLALGVFAVAAPAPAMAAATLSLPLDFGPDDTVLSARYSCADGTELVVQYINSGENRLALLPLNGTERIFVGVITGSGARYVSGAHELSTKGRDAMLADTRSGNDPVSCSVSGG